MLNNSCPCTNCASLTICNPKVQDILKEKKSHIEVLQRLMEKCVYVEEWANNESIKDICRQLTLLYGDVEYDICSERITHNEINYKYHNLNKRLIKFWKSNKPLEIY